MMKKILVVIMAILFFAQINSFAYIEKSNEQNILNIDFEDTVKFDNSGSFSIKSVDGRTYLSVPDGPGSAAKSPGYNISAEGIISISFDVLSNSSATIYLQMNNAEYKQFFCSGTYVENGSLRGPFVRDEDGVAQFFFGPGSPSPYVWNSFNIIYDTINGKVTGSCNGIDCNIGEYAIANYTKTKVDGDPVFLKGKITGIRFGTLETAANNGENGFDNIALSVKKQEKQTGTVEDTQYEVNRKKMLFLGVIDDSERDLNEIITRQEFYKAAFTLAKINPGLGTGTVFSDMEEQNELTGYAEYAYNLGVTQDSKFNPKGNISHEEASKLLSFLSVRFTNDISIVKKHIMQIQTEIAKGIKIKSVTQYVTFKNMLSMFDNALYIESNDILNENKQTLLEYNYNLREEKAVISSVDYISKCITVTDLDMKNERKYSAANISLLNIFGTYVKLWLNDDDEVIFISPINNSQVVYGYITSYNNGEYGTVIPVSKLRSIKLSVIPEAVNTSSGFKITENGNEIKGNVSLTGQLVRMIVEKGMAKRLDFLTDGHINLINEGGIITSVNSEKLIFTKGKNTQQSIDLENAYEVITIINGREESFDKLKKNMLFDYFMHDGYIYLIASDLIYNATVNSIQNNNIIINDETEIPCSKRIVYISDNGGKTYKNDTDIKTLLGNEVIILCDMFGCARYISEEDSGMFYGVVIGGYTNDETEDKILKVSLLIDEKMSENLYTYTDKKKSIYYPEVTYEEALSNAKDFSGKGIYKFEIKNKIIKKIEAIEWANNANMMTPSSNLSKTYKRFVANGKAWYHNGNIISLTDQFGEFNPYAIDVNLLSDKTMAGASVLVENTKPISELIVVKDARVTLYEPNITCAFVSRISDIYKDEKIYHQYELERPSGDLVLDIPENYPLMFANREISKGDLIIYSQSSANKEYSGMTIFGIVPYSDIPWGDFTKNKSYVNEGGTGYTKYIGVIKNFENGFIETTGENGSEWYRLSNNHKFIRYKNGKCKILKQDEVLGMEAFSYTSSVDIAQIIIVR